MKLTKIRFKSKTTLIVIVAIFGLFGAMLMAPQAVDARKVTCDNGGDYHSSIDYVNIGDQPSEVGHNISSDWSLLVNWTSGYGGGDDGNFRMVIEQTCTDFDKSAFFTLDTGVDGAKLLTIRHLDGLSNNDSFEVYVENQYVGSYTDVNDSTEIWVTSSFYLNENIIGEFNIEIRATDAIWPSCGTYGQLAISWASLDTCSIPRCGDETINGDEECDDGANRSGDGCSAICEIETTDLSITKEVDLDVAEVGDVLTYTITVNNAGAMNAYNLEVVDTLPLEVTLDETTVTDGGIFNGTETITWTPVDILGSSSWTTSFQATVVELPIGDSTIENLAELYQGVEELTQIDPPSLETSFFNKLFGIPTAHAIRTQTRTFLTSDTATTLVTVLGGPFLTIEKDVDATEAGPGDTLNYTIVVTNIGDQPAIDVVINDVLPAGLIYQDGTTTKEWVYDVIASGASETIEYVAIIEDNAVSDDYTNIASVGAVGLAIVEDDATTAIAEEVKIPIVLGEEALPALTIDKTVYTKVANPGQTITYSVLVTNIGDAVAEEVILIDYVAPGLQFTDTVAPTHTWFLGNILPGENSIVTYDVLVLHDNEPGIYPNTAEVWAVGVDSVYDGADVEVKLVQVLGAEILPTTGGSVMTFIYLIGAGLVAVFTGYVLKLTVAKK